MGGAVDGEVGVWCCDRVVAVHGVSLGCGCLFGVVGVVVELAWSLASSQSSSNASWRTRELSDSTALVFLCLQVLHVMRKHLPTISLSLVSCRTSMVKGAFVFLVFLHWCSFLS